MSYAIGESGFSRSRRRSTPAHRRVAPCGRRSAYLLSLRDLSGSQSFLPNGSRIPGSLIEEGDPRQYVASLLNMGRATLYRGSPVHGTIEQPGGPLPSFGAHFTDRELVHGGRRT